MQDQSRINQKLIEENTILKQRIQELERLQAESKQAEEALRESEALQGVLLANLPAGVIIIDPMTRIIENVNNAAAVMFGVQAERIVGHRCHAYLCPAMEGACPVCDLGNEVDNAEREMVCADGSRRPVLKSVKSVQIRGQEKLLECFVDITAQKQAEQALRDSEAKYQTLAEKAIAGVYVVQDGRFRFINSNAAFYAGYTREELLNQDANILVNPEDSEKVRQNARAMLTGKESSPYEFRIITKQGENRWIMETVTSILHEGRPAILGNSMNITERKRVEAALEEKHRQLQQAFDEIRTLRGIVPICAYCKKIRDDKGYWNQVEQYVSTHSEATFSHGICPTCFEEEMKEIKKKKPT